MEVQSSNISDKSSVLYETNPDKSTDSRELQPENNWYIEGNFFGVKLLKYIDFNEVHL